ncbi:hypothetical protein THAOC_19531 [Thalassiosira oceanica]|uniref:Uncharacterized protein n=1 Tax=Thalassiosira oceanica TaxID=159749 RepID=K0S2A3_THAOC|nr:hypothetical protein THAOC_19531 [Thalassiosira oceanica]|eukprot:EJK60168.1 hypothetical protein THAOC_19531 [Thalassiosira oceanica]
MECISSSVHLPSTKSRLCTESELESALSIPILPANLFLAERVRVRARGARRAADRAGPRVARPRPDPGRAGRHPRPAGGVLPLPRPGLRPPGPRRGGLGAAVMSAPPPAPLPLGPPGEDGARPAGDRGGAPAPESPEHGAEVPPPPPRGGRGGRRRGAGGPAGPAVRAARPVGPVPERGPQPGAQDDHPALRLRPRPGSRDGLPGRGHDGGRVLRLGEAGPARGRAHVPPVGEGHAQRHEPRLHRHGPAGGGGGGAATARCWRDDSDSDDDSDDSDDRSVNCVCEFDSGDPFAVPGEDGEASRDEEDPSEDRMRRGTTGPGLWHCYTAVFDGDRSVVRVDGAEEPRTTRETAGLPDGSGPDSLEEAGTRVGDVPLDGLTIGSDHLFNESLCYGEFSSGCMRHDRRRVRRGIHLRARRVPGQARPVRPRARRVPPHGTPRHPHRGGAVRRPPPERRRLARRGDRLRPPGGRLDEAGERAHRPAEAVAARFRPEGAAPRRREPPERVLEEEERHHRGRGQGGEDRGEEQQRLVGLVVRRRTSFLLGQDENGPSAKMPQIARAPELMEVGGARGCTPFCQGWEDLKCQKLFLWLWLHP